MNQQPKTFNMPYPFGMPMPGRSYTSENYRFGFNGMEKDDEMKGEGNSLDFGARIYDSRLERWLSVDKHFKLRPDLTPYRGFNNNPIVYKDPDGNFEVSQDFANNYPIITRYLDLYILKDVEKTSKIVNALGEHSTSKLHNSKGGYILNSNRIKEFFSFGSGPKIIPKEKVGPFESITANGYTPSSLEIHINVRFLEKVEEILREDNYTNEEKGAALLASYSLILHESVHAGDWLDGILKNGEAGVDFEIDVFGKYLEKMKQEDGTWSLESDVIDLYNEITNSENEEKQKVLPTLPQNNEEDE